MDNDERICYLLVSDTGASLLGVDGGERIGAEGEGGEGKKADLHRDILCKKVCIK